MNKQTHAYIPGSVLNFSDHAEFKAYFDTYINFE